MTEDMRERLVETVGNQIMLAVSCQWKPQILREKVDEKLREVWQAALSSAGTSGTADAEYDQKSCDVIMNLSMLVRRLCARLHKHEPDAKMIDQALGYLRGEGLQGSLLRGDSLSGKGEATKEVMPSGSPSTELGHDSSTPRSDKGRGAPSGQQETSASAPDRAEKLARLKRWKYFDKTDLLPAGFSPRPNGEWVKFTDVASLLRREMERE